MNILNSILILLVTFIVVFLEASVNGVRNLLGAQVDLLPALMVYASLSAGLTTVTGVAILGGLFFDTLSANSLGTSILPLFLVGYAIHLRRELILRDQLFAQFVLGLIASFIAPVIALLLMSVTKHSPLVGWGTIWQLIVMSLGGALLTPVLFRVFDSLNYGLTYRPVVETSFRLDRQIKRGRK